MTAAAIRAALGLWRSESDRETYLAVAVAAAVVLPLVVSHYRNRRNAAVQ